MNEEEKQVLGLSCLFLEVQARSTKQNNKQSGEPMRLNFTLEEKVLVGN